MNKKLNLNTIRIDGGTQSRVEINNDAVSDYAEAVKVGIEFPPVVVFHDGADHWLADGFHRFHAHKQAGKASILAEIHNGTARDAILFSVGANGAHGLRRSNADKRKAVETVLRDAEWAKWSDRKVADLCGVGAPLVGDIRKAICNPITDAPAVRTVQRAGRTYQQDTSRIGKTEEPSKPAKAPKRTLDAPAPEGVEALTDADNLREAQDTLAEIVRENETLRDRLAIESMDVSEDEKTAASETIRELRALVKTLEAENDAIKVSRDTYMRENSELKKSVNYWRKQAEKAAKDAAA